MSDPHDPLDALDWRRSRQFEFRGTVLGRDGQPVDLTELFAIAADAVSVLPDERFTTRPRAELRPKTIFTASMAPNALAHTKGEGALEINLGIILTLDSLPYITGLLRRLGERNGMSFEEAERFSAPAEALREVDTLLSVWRRSAQSNWSKLFVAASPSTDFFRYQHLVHFVVGHEMSHWLETVYKADAWRRITAATHEHIRTWLSADHDIPPQVLREIAALLESGRVLDRWTREISADQMAYYRCLDTFGGGWSPRLRMWLHATSALLFSLLTLLEGFHQLMGTPIPVDTHPPARIRRSIFMHIRAREAQMSLPEFVEREWGAGAMTSFIMDRILDDYFAKFSGRRRP